MSITSSIERVENLQSHVRDVQFIVTVRYRGIKFSQASFRELGQAEAACDQMRLECAEAVQSAREDERRTGHDKSNR